MPEPWRSGTTPTLFASSAAERPVELGRVEQRAVAGQQRDRGRALRLGGGDADHRRLGVAGVGGVLHDLDARLGGQHRDLGLAADDDHAVDQLRARELLEHVGGHRRGEQRAVGRREHVGEALLGGVEALDRDDGGGLHAAEAIGRAPAAPGSGTGRVQSPIRVISTPESSEPCGGPR